MTCRTADPRTKPAAATVVLQLKQTQLWPVLQQEQADLQRRRLEMKLEISRMLTGMKQLKLKEWMSSASSRSKPQVQLQCRGVAAFNLQAYSNTCIFNSALRWVIKENALRVKTTLTF